MNNELNALDQMMQSMEQNPVLPGPTDEQKIASRQAESANLHKEKEERYVHDIERCLHDFFVSEPGEKVVSYIRDRILVPQLYDHTSANASHLCVYEDGLKEGMRIIFKMANNHATRINSGV